MARYDKYEPYAGGFRALLAADYDADDFGKVVGVGLDANGRVVKGAGTSGLVGVLIINNKKYAGDVVDIMTDGEIVDFRAYKASDSSLTNATPGTKYFIAADGSVDTTAGGKYAGVTVEAKDGSARLIVRVEVG